MTDRIWLRFHCGCRVAFRLEIPHVVLCTWLCVDCIAAGRTTASVEASARDRFSMTFLCPQCGTDDPNPANYVCRCGCNLGREKWVERLTAVVVDVAVPERRSSIPPPPPPPDYVPGY